MIIISYSHHSDETCLQNKGKDVIMIDVDETDIFLQSKITKLFTAVSIPMLILIIISLLINCITKSYYQNTSSLLEKQINMQLDYYSKLEKKNSELREFRHDFKIICSAFRR